MSYTLRYRFYRAILFYQFIQPIGPCLLRVNKLQISYLIEVFMLNDDQENIHCLYRTWNHCKIALLQWCKILMMQWQHDDCHCSTALMYSHCKSMSLYQTIINNIAFLGLKAFSFDILWIYTVHSVKQHILLNSFIIVQNSILILAFLLKFFFHFPK